MDGMKIEGGAMETVVAKAIIDSLTPEAREELVSGAIKSLLKQDVPESHGQFAPRISRVQSMFNDAAQRVANDIIRKELAESPEFKAQIKGLFEEIAAKLFNNPEAKDNLVNKIATAIADNITRY